MIAAPHHVMVLLMVVMVIVIAVHRLVPIPHVTMTRTVQVLMLMAAGDVIRTVVVVMGKLIISHGKF